MTRSIPSFSRSIPAEILGLLFISASLIAPAHARPGNLLPNICKNSITDRLLPPPARNARVYETIPMKAKYAGETNGLVLNETTYRTLYLTNAKEREPYRIFFHDGVAHYADGSVVTGLGPRSETGSGVEFLFVMDEAGNFYIQNTLYDILDPIRGLKTKSTRGHFHHSTFLGGGPVSSPGLFKFRDGVITGAQPHSGHYLDGEAPSVTWESLRRALRQLKSEGVDLSRIEVYSPTSFFDEYDAYAIRERKPKPPSGEQLLDPAFPPPAIVIPKAPNTNQLFRLHDFN